MKVALVDRHLFTLDSTLLDFATKVVVTLDNDVHFYNTLALTGLRPFSVRSGSYVLYILK